ncbi:MAG: hypothetical protein HZA54_05055, partial [Planctomycetes bacterium]|nr:hypothetical protein [Planctomycetota bacterium]
PGGTARIPTIEEGPDEAPPPGAEVTFAPSEHPPELPPAGSISVIHDPYKDPAERAAYEAEQKRIWEERKARELEGMLVYLGKELELADVQKDKLRAVLTEESRRRIEVVEDITAQRITEGEFRTRVDRIRAEAREQLALIFTEPQFAKYKTLKPKHQVLNDQTIQGH